MAEEIAENSPRKCAGGPCLRTEKIHEQIAENSPRSRTWRAELDGHLGAQARAVLQHETGAIGERYGKVR